MDLTLRRGLHHREVSGAHILFDLPADRYILLAGSTAACFGRFLSGCATDGDLAELSARDLIEPAGYRATLGHQAFVPPTSSLTDDGLPEGGLRGTTTSLWFLRRARSDLRRRPLSDVLEDLARTKPVRAGSDDKKLAHIAADFRRAGRFISMQDQCLVRGVAMLNVLHRKGVAASLVFGVTIPFAAHCWIQAGDRILTDPFDIVRNYQPIYIV